MVSKKKIPKYRFLILGTLLCIIICLFSFWSVNSIYANPSNQIIIFPLPGQAYPNLQLRTFFVITPPPSFPSEPMLSNTVQPSGGAQISQQPVPPTNGGFCPEDSVKPAGSTCTCTDINVNLCPAPADGQCPSGSLPSSLLLDNPVASSECMTIAHEGDVPPGCQAACIGKPVIYLYPTKTMNVSVSVTVPGEIIASNPLYDTGGWKNITAHPDGSLVYNNHSYHELFYESSVNSVVQPQEGQIIPTANLSAALIQDTYQLGLSPSEQNEFMQYWLPRLNALHSSYILFSILPPAEKDTVDHVVISPTPETIISFIAYFKPLSSPSAIHIKPLSLPLTPPKRLGFTSVEWGGTIAQ